MSRKVRIRAQADETEKGEQKDCSKLWIVFDLSTAECVLISKSSIKVSMSITLKEDGCLFEDHEGLQE